MFLSMKMFSAMEEHNRKQAEYDRKDQQRLTSTINKVAKLLVSHPSVLVIQCSNVGAFQFQKIRKMLRGEAVIIRGKVSHLRTAIQQQLQEHPELKPLLKHGKGEIGLVLTNMDIFYIKNKIEAEKCACGLRLNSRAPEDIIIPGGETPLEPTQTSFFAALNIAIKIMKGKMYIINNVTIFRKGDLITESGFILFQSMRLKPVTQQVKVTLALCNGVLLDEEVLNSAEQQLETALRSGIQNIAAISLATGLPNQSSLLYIIRNGLRNVQAVSTTMESR